MCVCVLEIERERKRERELENSSRGSLVGFKQMDFTNQVEQVNPIKIISQQFSTIFVTFQIEGKGKSIDESCSITQIIKELFHCTKHYQKKIS